MAQPKIGEGIPGDLEAARLVPPQGSRLKPRRLAAYLGLFTCVLARLVSGVPYPAMDGKPDSAVSRRLVSQTVSSFRARESAVRRAAK